MFSIAAGTARKALPHLSQDDGDGAPPEELVLWAPSKRVMLPLVLYLALLIALLPVIIRTGDHWLMLLSICLVSAPTSHGPNKVLPSLSLYCFGTFLVATVIASAATNTFAWAVQIIPLESSLFSFVFCALFTKPPSFVQSSPIHFFSESLLGFFCMFLQNKMICRTHSCFREEISICASISPCNLCGSNFPYILLVEIPYDFSHMWSLRNKTNE